MHDEKLNKKFKLNQFSPQTQKAVSENKIIGYNNSYGLASSENSLSEIEEKTSPLKSDIDFINRKKEKTEFHFEEIEYNQETETKSLSSLKSSGSNREQR